MFVVPQVVSTYVALSQFSQNEGDKEKWLHREQLAIQKSSLCWSSREGLLATAQLMQALACPLLQGQACLSPPVLAQVARAALASV